MEQGMSLSTRILLGLAGFVLLGFGSGDAQEYPSGFKFMRVPDPRAENNPPRAIPTRSEPAIGRFFTDETFHTRIRRVSATGKIRHEYARFDPYNNDHSLIILHDTGSGDFLVYRTAGIPYPSQENLAAKLDFTEPRWDPENQSVIWGLKDLHIVRFDVSTGRSSLVKDFTADPVIGPIIRSQPDLYAVTTRGEGEASSDMRYWALALQGSQDDYRLRYIFCWDRQQDKVLGLIKLSADKAELVDWVGMSPLGNWVIIGADAGEGDISGLTIADKSLSKFHKLAEATAHSDVALNSRGDEVIVMQNTRTDFIDMIPLDFEVKPVTDPGQYRSGRVTPLYRLFYADESPFGLQSGIHISGNTQGWCLISTYIEPERAARNWMDRTLTLARLDARQPAVYYLAHVYNTTFSYWQETHGTISRDGTRVLWASNWGRSAGEDQTFLLELQMPKTWRAILGDAP